MTGFEPATSGATVRRSATELHPPSGDCELPIDELATARRRLSSAGETPSLTPSGEGISGPVGDAVRVAW